MFLAYSICKQIYMQCSTIYEPCDKTNAIKNNRISCNSGHFLMRNVISFRLENESPELFDNTCTYYIQCIQHT